MRVPKAKKKERYKLDLAALQGVCAANYLGMTRLFPSMREQRHARVLLDQGGLLEMEVLEMGPYTTLLAMAEQEPGFSHLAPKACQVKIYHDARLAEVVAWGKAKKLQGRYHYPNEQMYQEDEKWQMNRFLGEWISHCLGHGRSEWQPGAMEAVDRSQEQLEQD